MTSSGAPFTLNVMLDNAPEASTALAPLRIHWDSGKLHLNDITPGELFSRDGVAVHVEKDIRNGANNSGEAVITLSREAGSAGISGSGTLATLSFTAASAGASAVAVTEAGVKTAKATIPAQTEGVVVTVQ